MASVAELNVVIGARIKALQDGLKDAERSLRKSGAQMSRLGSDITSSLSLPLALAGGAAISAAGDIEALTLALKSQLGTSEAAAKELGLLTEAAKNPGLGVEQAVRGSVRLQGVGFAAEEARKVLVQMGNAIAATGGSAQELDNVTRQFAQMTSKGRVLQEDVSILSENMPGLAQLMQKAFGTQSVEAIHKMGVSGKEFVLQITKAAEELPRVEGGIKNSIGNALDSLKQSAAKVGFAINSAFDVTGAIENFSAFVLRVAEGFSALNPTLQKTILGVAGLAIAIGPLMRGYGGLLNLGSQLISGVSSMAGVFGTLSGAALRLYTGIRALGLAFTAISVVALVGGLIALADAMGWFNREATAAEKLQASLNDLHADAEKSIASEKGAVSTLIGVLNSETSSRQAKEQALKQLQSISVEYFGGLRIENGLVSGLNEAYKAYIKNLILAAVAKKAEARLVEIDELKTDELKKQVALQEQLAKIQPKSSAANAPARFGASDSQILSGSTSEAGAIAQRITDSQKLVASFKAEEEALTSKAQAGFEAQAKEKIAADARLKQEEKRVKNLKDQSDGTEELKGKAKVLRDVLDDVANSVVKAKLLGEDEDIAKLEALRKGIEKLIDAGFKPASDAVKDLKAQLDILTQAPKPVTIDTIAPIPGITPVTSQSAVSPGATPPPILDVAPKLTEAQKAFERYAESLKYAEEVQESLNNGTFKFSTGLSEVINKLIEQGDVMGSVFAAMGDSIAQAASAGETSFLKLGQAAAGAAAKIVRAYIQQAVAAAVAKAIGSSIPFPFNLAAGAAAGGIAAALFTSAIGKIGIKGFAAGTRDAPGGLALVGERGPEILNLPRHSQVLNAGTTSTMLRNSQASMNLTGEFVIKGTDLVLTLDRVQNKNRRYQ